MNTESTDTSVPSPEPVATPVATGVTPGTMIREARQAARLSVDDLAAHTKLARATVEALERDDFGALLEPVYVRGYYRKCAKVLNLDEKALLDAYAVRVTPKTPQAPAKLRLASGTDLGSSSRLPTAMGLLFVIVAIVVCASLWWLRDATAPTPQVLNTEVLSASPVAPFVTTPPPAASTEASTPAEAQPETEPSSTDAAGPSVVSPSEAAPAVAAPATSEATSEPAAAAPASGPLLIRFNNQSWIRVLDANGRTLLNGLIPAGERRQLDGKPPFDLFIGAAPAVSVSYQGQAIDLKPYMRDNATARLRLPLPAATP